MQRGKDKRIDRALVAATLSLHDKAYKLLCFLADEARADPGVLSAEQEATLLDLRACTAWIGAQAAAFPGTLRPAPGQESALAGLLGSFLRTSFHIRRLEWDGKLVDAKLVPGPEHEGARAKRRARHGGDPRIEALHRLCRDEGVSVARTRLSHVAHRKDCEADVRLWSYAVGLVLRARGGGEGEADLTLWRKIPDRKTLDVERVWDARARLLAALNGGD